MSEYIRGAIPIQTPTKELGNEAQKAHRQWLTLPDDVQAMHIYATALRRYGVASHRPKLIAHAEALLNCQTIEAVHAIPGAELITPDEAVRRIHAAKQ